MYIFMNFYSYGYQVLTSPSASASHSFGGSLATMQATTKLIDRSIGWDIQIQSQLQYDVLKTNINEAQYIATRIYLKL
jgi:hypothetical protein